MKKNFSNTHKLCCFKIISSNAGQSGFTILELIIVIAIISILASAASLAILNAQERAKLALFYSDIRQVKIAAERFSMDIGFFPLEVVQGIDPGLASSIGWKDGGHSVAWDQAESAGLLSGWSGPYLKEWKGNPWGGTYDFDNYPPGYSYLGIEGGSIYLTMRPSTAGGTEGMPTSKYEELLENTGVDQSPLPYCVSVKLDTYPK